MDRESEPKKHGTFCVIYRVTISLKKKIDCYQNYVILFFIYIYVILFYHLITTHYL